MAEVGPLKLVIVSRFSERIGGAENRLYRFLEHVDSARLEVVVVFLGHGGLERDVNELGFPTYAVPAVRLRQIGKSLRTVWKLRRIMKWERPDLILNWGSKAQILTSPAASLSGYGGRVAWWQLDIPPGSLEMRLATLLPADVIACSSRLVAEAQGRQRPRRRTFVVHPGIDPPREVPDSEREAIRSSLSLPLGLPVVGTVARLQTRKRQDLLIKAIANLRDRGREAYGLIVGGDSGGWDPEYARSLHELVGALGLEDSVTFTGEVGDPTPYYRLMDVFVMTCPVEAFGNALIEAMGCGVASVAIGSAGPSEIIEDGTSGLLVAEPDTQLFADAFERLLGDDAFRERLASAGRRHQRERFSAVRMTRELEQQLLMLTL
jgi:glycosyltransferase involved in cell wall biosynthesis